ncbi:hypothetical protein [Microbacterium sp. VKM Ac-2923]|uniref:hypothetical protein n=1 Tax=Microbacterium sp. VKM Ac-2923 TaxID=2929476 RepID=UPI001FB3ABB0|nr:hypothetical protein [Microbacterium sp. VKM Ac-2923]MCJ1708430.1 hypothetical protein [Microbacterium sp. VKM Ac-2923]
MNAVSPFGTAVMTQAVVAPSRRRARDILEGRVLTIINWETADSMAGHLDPTYEGLVVTGAERHKKVRKLREMFPELVILAESNSHKDHTATEDAPWLLPSDDDALIPAPNLGEILNAQRTSGASVVVLPAGFVEAGDHEALRGLVFAANELGGDDIALPLYLAAGWLRKKHKQFLIAALNESVHPVLLAFGSSTNPLDGKGRQELYREIASATHAFGWRTDLAGLAAFASGGMGTAIGTAPSTRRFTPPNASGHARRPDDATPYVLIPGHMHWMKTRAMREEIYVGAPSPTCGCLECDGAPIDRFTENDHAAAARHSHAVIAWYANTLAHTPVKERPSRWRALAQDAVVAHEMTGATIGRPWNVPTDVAAWAAS